MTVSDQLQKRASYDALDIVASELPSIDPEEEPLPVILYFSEVPEDRDEDLLECRIRLRGTPQADRPRLWRADSDTIAPAIDLAIAWCSEITSPDEIILATGLTRHTVARHDLERAFRLAADHLPSHYRHMSAFCLTPERWRGASMALPEGRLTLMEGDAKLREGDWLSAVEALRAVLVESAPWATYGFVKRGQSPHTAEIGSSLEQDWLDLSQRVASSNSATLESSAGIDAFGIQLLGPGHRRAAIDESFAGWQITDGLAHGHWLLESTDPQAWFSRDAPLPRFDLYPNAWWEALEVPASGVLAEGRITLAPLLLTPETVIKHWNEIWPIRPENV